MKNNGKKILRVIGEIVLTLLVMVGFAMLMIPLTNLPWKPYEQASADPYEGIVCMHGKDIRIADYDADHICEHMAVLRSEEKYQRTLAFPEIERITIEPERVVLIERFVNEIETCDKESYIFELTANGIESWPVFDYEVRVYCANYLPVDERITGILDNVWTTEADGRSYVELDVEHCKEVIEKCRQEEQRQLMVQAAIKEDVSHLGLNGYKVHDLKQIHDYICTSTKYDESLSHTTAYDFFVEDSVVCTGYAEAFKAVCDYVGLEVECIVGAVGSEGHAWNSVIIDGETYYIDCTWDDMKDGEISYEHFLTYEPSGIAASEIESVEPSEPPTEPQEGYSDSTDTETTTEESELTEPTEPVETPEEPTEDKYSPEEEAATEPLPEPTEPPVQQEPVETVAEEMARRGSVGRLTIPSIGVNVALFDTSVYNVNHSQPIVDASDSAAYLSDSVGHYGFVMIGDHVHQGFSAIKQALAGSTLAYIDRGTYTETYVCTEVFVGYNGYGDRTGMFDANGNDVAGRNPGGLCMYTCNSDGTITITFWQPQ